MKKIYFNFIIILLLLITSKLTYADFIILQTGWNMFSLHVNTTINANDLKTRCGTNVNIWNYQNGRYVEATEIKPGFGYWIKLSSNCDISLEGGDVSINNLPQLKAGWNQVGGLSSSVSFDSIKGNCVKTAGPWRYNPSTRRYESASSLESGYGYWIKVASDCRLETQICSDVTAYGSCSSTKPKYCDNGNLINKCSHCGCPTYSSCNITSEDCHTTTVTECTPGNNMIKQTDYPSGSCLTSTTYKWSNVPCANSKVCKEGLCKLVDADLTSYTLPSGKYARSDTISIPYRIKNVGEIQWCFLTETQLTKSDTAKIWSGKTNSISSTSSYTDLLYHSLSCSDPLGTWSGLLYSYTDTIANGGWKVWGTPSYNIQVVECLNDQECVNCLGSDYKCNTTTNRCYTPIVFTCSDGTAYGSCSSTKPKYCSSGTLINKCSQCGCPSGTCQTDGSCQSCDSSCKAQSFASGTCKSPTGGGFVASAELLSYGNSYTDITDSEANTLFSLFQEQGFTEFTMRLPAFSYTSSGATSTQVSNIKRLMRIADQYDLQVNLDLHTWYTTWDNDFRDSASGSAANRAAYIQYVRNTIPQFESEPNLKAWMVMNEPQARTASTSENSFIRDVIREAKTLTTRQVSVRFMMGYSPSTDHYATYLDDEVDFLCRNSYWDSRNPSTTVYGATQAKFLSALDRAHSQGKELWITEFGKTSDQVGYFKENVAYYRSVGVDRVFAWAIQTEGTESYNIFNGMTPGAAFYELVSDSNTPTCSGTSIGQDGCSSGICCCSGTVQQCSDGTLYNQCSSTKPKYCSSGTLINGCGSPYNCGCPTGQTCQADGSCKSVVSTGTIWGANLYVPKFSDSNPSGNAATYLSNTVFQAAKDMGITHIILWQYNFNENAQTITQAQMVDAVTRMKNYGLQPIIVLDYDVDKAVALVTALGSNCTMYEVCKEPHVSGSSCYADEATYASRWNEVVSACREVNPNAMYGGPAVGSIPGTSPRSETWMRKWLEQCDGDFVSVHAFYDPIDSKSNVVSRARTEIIADVAYLKAILADYGKQNLPIVYSEVQWTAAVTTNGWDMDQTFNDDFANSLMSTMEEQNVYAAMFWTLIGYNNNFAIIRPPSQSYEKKPQYYSIQDYLTGVTNTCTSCGSWTSGSCNVGGCVNQRQQTRICTPAGCMPTDGLGTSRCVADTSCGVATIYAGFRSSPYGYQTQQTPTWWVSMTKGMSAKVPNSAPTIIWILGEIMAPGNLCKLYFPSPGGTYQNIIFNSNDVAEQYLSAFDANGIKVWLQVEPGDADVTQLIDLVLNRYSHHSSVIGFGVDVEWYKYSTNNNEDSPGKAVTDTEAQTWINKVKSYNSNYKLFLKHWLTNKMPPTFRNADLVFIDDGQDLGSLQNMINEFKTWGNSFSSSSVGFQFGYPSDKSWWSQLSDPEGQIANTLISNIPNTKGVYWVDFSITDILCSDNTLYGSCSATKPKYCSSGTLINKCSQCGCPTDSSCNTTSEDCHTTTVTECTPGNNMIKQTDYPSGSCLASTTYKWSNVSCANSKVCKEGLCKLVDADLTSYTTPSGKYARGNTITIPYTIKNVGDAQWCFLTEAGTTKSNNSNIWPKKLNSVLPASSTTDSLSYTISCSDPLGTWSGSLYTHTDAESSGGWKVWGTPTFSFNVIECLNDQDCVNCLGSGRKCNTTTNKCYTPIVFTCSDGTAYGSCSSTKPKYCSSGTLINGCGSPYNCGCPTGYTCQTDGSCKSVVSTGTIVSTELINFYGMTTSEVQTFIQLIDNQNISLLIARLNAMDEFQSGTSSGITKAKQVIQEANSRGIQVAVDLHTWYTTWDNYFRDSASNQDTYRSQYITYVRNVLSAFSDSNVYSFMVMNEPQARTATNSENQFIIDVINAAKEVTDRPISVRFMGGYSPSTGHYSLQIDQISDYLCRNVYWDPRQPGVSVYGTTEEKINTAISTAHNQGKELWITEFGKSKSNLEEQRAYVEAFVSWSKNKSVDAIFCWVSQPEGGSGESYNIFTDYTPHPAFYELVND